MAASLLSLPAELQLQLFKIVEGFPDPLGTFFPWSCTCSSYRTQIAPYIFKEVLLRNTEKSGNSVKAIAEGQQARHVKELRYEALLFSNEGKDEDRKKTESNDGGDGNDTINFLPSIVRTTLSELGKFPNLETLSVKFDWEAHCDGDDACWALIVNEDEPFYSTEELAGWWALLCGSFEAIATSHGSSIRRFEILQLIAVLIPTFSTDAWHKLLNQLHSFRLTIRGGENSAGWSVSTVSEYQEVMGDLDDFFFDHLTSATDLAVEASEDCLLGMEDACRLLVNPKQMPSLRTLHLGNMFIGPDLVHFVVGLKDTLESIELVNFYGSEVESSMPSGGVPWYTLFDSVCEAQPAKLRRFELRALNAPLAPYGEYPPEDGEERTPESEEVKEVRDTLKAHPSMRVFPYAYLILGCISCDVNLNVDMFRQGADQTAYDQLMELVAKNAKKAL